MRIGSVCSGVGTPELSWSAFGGRPLFFSEIDEAPSELLAQRFPSVPNLGDMSKIDGSVWRGKIDVFVGGTPCQAFSVAGKRRSLDDDRGNLTLKFIELADQIGAPITVWENVPGVLTTKDNAFGCLLGGLAGAEDAVEPGPKPELGKGNKYWKWNRELGRHVPKWSRAGYVAGPKRTIAWRILDAQHFGVAQRRKRIFLIASAREWADPREILFEFEGMRRDSPPIREAQERTASVIAASSNSNSGTGGCSNFATVAEGNSVLNHWEGGPHPTLNQSHNTGGIGLSNQELFSQMGAGLVGALDTQCGFEKATAQSLHAGHLVPHGFRMTAFGEYTADETASTMKARDYKDATDLVTVSDIYSIQGNMIRPNAGCNGKGWSEGENPMYTLTAADRHSVCHNFRVRRLMPIECERLQGLPDNWTRIKWKGKSEDNCPDGIRYKAIGNGMCKRCLDFLGERIQGALCQ